MISPRDVRTALGEVHASYALPFLASMLTAAAILVLVIGSLREGSTFWACFALACALLLIVAIIILFAMVAKPQLLRSQRTLTFMETITLIGNDEISQPDKDRIERLLDRYLSPPESERVEGAPSRKKAISDDPEDEDDA